MYKYLTIATLLLSFGKAEAHSHPGIDALTHSLEHMLTAYSAWLPYLFTAGLSIAAAALLRSLWLRAKAPDRSAK
ncbi:hypothetical protein IVG45_09925 [Methylomonas sp. LL1]|uniref:hypothetical protein n=1 Tax=Methylomonas sp. LL1 TaxID=2785785 RepID=UPI0018C44B87|nr:hypothetical protein [Methylomonas sp. LL1]QPK65216.1 hypothetical protein IVG45_09925 [Methylomonas sp. LL1]